MFRLVKPGVVCLCVKVMFIHLVIAVTSPMIAILGGEHLISSPWNRARCAVDAISAGKICCQGSAFGPVVVRGN